MAVRIKSVTITPDELTVGQAFLVAVGAEEPTWNDLKNELASWAEVRRSFENWNKVRDFVYSIPKPDADTDCVYSKDGFALFDIDAVQISVTGGATLEHMADETDAFIEAVKNG